MILTAVATLIQNMAHSVKSTETVIQAWGLFRIGSLYTTVKMRCQCHISARTPQQCGKTSQHNTRQWVDWTKVMNFEEISFLKSLLVVWCCSGMSASWNSYMYLLVCAHFPVFMMATIKTSSRKCSLMSKNVSEKSKMLWLRLLMLLNEIVLCKWETN